MAQNKDRTYGDDGLYFDFIDNNKTQIDNMLNVDFTKVDDVYLKSRTYYPHRICVHSGQAQATESVTTTWAVAWGPILATDIVHTQVITAATAAYILKQTINASTGFTVTFNTAPGIGTFDWEIFRLVSALT
jgi:hypothetical protein